MATTETISSNYAGEAAQRFFSAALLQAGSISSGAVSLQSGIQYKWNLPKLNLSGIIADATCDFTDAGTVTRSERVLTLEEFEVNMKLCVKTYRPTFDRMGGSRSGSLAPSFADYLAELTLMEIAANRETTIWQGVNATAGEFDGFETIFTSEADQPAAQEVLGTTLTKANIITEMEKVEDAVPNAIFQKPNFAYMVGVKTAKLYSQAQADLGAFDAYHERGATFNFHGKPILVCPGMSDDVIFATYTDNFWYGIGDPQDTASVDVIDTRQTLGDGNVRVAAYWGDGVQVANAEDVVTYGITNAGN